jgi:tRNA(Ile)-lysidine synthase TilS/MesJ
MNAVSADGIITAQHRDDVIETLILNVLRGTGRRGLSPMAEEAGVIRPLLGIGKSELVEYARGRGLKWIEDPTNQDLRYRRNWVRHKLLPELRGQDPKFDDKLLEIIAEAEKLNRNVNKKLISLVHYKEEPKEISVDGNLVQTLDVNVLQELLIQMLITLSPGMQVDRRTIEHLAIDLKCGRLNGQRQLTGRLFAQAARDKVAIAFKAP